MFLSRPQKVKRFRSLLFIILCFVAFGGYAQQRGPVYIQLTDSSTEVTNEELRDITVKVTNSGAATFKGYLHIDCGKGAKLATKQDAPVTVEPGKSLFVPAKVFIGSTTPEGNIHYTAQLLDAQKVSIGASDANLYLAPSRNMRASLNEHDLIMRGTGSRLEVPVLVSNRGNRVQEVTIVISYPTELQDKTNKTIKLEVPAFKDTIIFFTRKVSRAMMNMGYMDISVYGVYNTGDYFSITSASVQSLSSSKKFGRRRSGSSGSMTSNYVSVGTQNTFSDNESYFVQARANYSVTKDFNVGFSFNMSKWKMKGMPTLLNDTWLGLEYKGLGLKMGNVTQNGELSYNGRGAEMYLYTDSMRRNKIYAGYLDKSFNLINGQAGNTSFGKAMWAGMVQDYGKVKNNTSVAYDEDNFVRAKSMLVVNEATMQLSELFFAGVKAGVATSKSSGEDAEQHESFTAGASLNGNLTKSLSLSSDNVYASGYYPGTRRGALSLNERLNWRLGKTTLTGGYMYNSMNPKFFRTSGTSFRSNNTSSTMDVSIARAYGSLSLALAPQFYHESGNWSINGSTIAGNMKSFRLSASISYSNIATRQNIMFHADAGQYTTNFMSGARWQFRTNFAYNYRFFRLTANVQKGNFYLSEAFQEASGGQTNLRLNISPALTGSFFNNHLKADAGLTYYKDFFVTSVLYNASLNCNLGSTRFFATMQYNTFVSSASYRNVQFGITQMLPESNKGALMHKGEINLFAFYDVNSNGVFDGKDSVANGYLAYLDRTMMITNRGGHISYSKLPAGDYKIFFPTQKGWYGPDQFVVLKDKEKANLQIPLRLTGTVSGKIAYEFDEVLSYSTRKELAGQAITAVNDEGKSFEAKTDDNGQFMLYLPTGRYTFSVTSVPKQIDVIPTHNNVQPLQVNSGQIINDVDFTLKVKQRKIEVKKFGQ